MLRHLIAATIIVSFVVVVSKAEAADPTAQAFVDTVALGTLGMPDTLPQVRANIEALELERCAGAIDQKAPERALVAGAEITIGGTIQAAFAPTLPVMAGVVKGLDGIPTNDPALRSGRAAWRATYQHAAALRPLTGACRKLEAWKRRGWAPGAMPVFLPPKFVTAMRALTSEALSDKFAVGQKRLRALGISRKDAEVWSGDVAFAPIGEEISDALDGVFSTTDEVPFGAALGG